MPSIHVKPINIYSSHHQKLIVGLFHSIQTHMYTSPYQLPLIQYSAINILYTTLNPYMHIAPPFIYVLSQSAAFLKSSHPPDLNLIAEGSTLKRPNILLPALG